MKIPQTAQPPPPSLRREAPAIKHAADFARSGREPFSLSLVANLEARVANGERRRRGQEEEEQGEQEEAPEEAGLLDRLRPRRRHHRRQEASQVRQAPHLPGKPRFPAILPVLDPVFICSAECFGKPGGRPRGGAWLAERVNLFPGHVVSLFFFFFMGASFVA